MMHAKEKHWFHCTSETAINESTSICDGTLKVCTDSVPINVARVGTVKRETKETKVDVSINLDGTGICQCNTGIPFLDHMLDVSRLVPCANSLYKGGIHLWYRVAHHQPTSYRQCSVILHWRFYMALYILEGIFSLSFADDCQDKKNYGLLCIQFSLLIQVMLIQVMSAADTHAKVWLPSWMQWSADCEYFCVCLMLLTLHSMWMNDFSVLSHYCTWTDDLQSRELQFQIPTVIEL